MEELDGINWPRYLRAMDADRMETVEELRMQNINRKIEAKDISDSDWKIINENNQIVDELGE